MPESKRFKYQFSEQTTVWVESTSPEETNTILEALQPVDWSGTEVETVLHQMEGLLTMWATTEHDHYVRTFLKRVNTL